jgi:glycosyltransferase involved in cell wall biosynthesis
MQRKKHLLIVPAWYPTPRQPYAGIFIREQANALHLCGVDVDVTLWNWCPGLFHLSFKRPLEMLRTLWQWNRRPTAAWTQDRAGFRVFVRPVFEPPRPFRGQTTGLVRGLREVIREVTATVGEIDIVHAHVGRTAGWASSVVCPEFKIPWVLTEHMGPRMIAELAPRGSLDPRWLKAYRECDALITVGTAQADLLRHFTNRTPTVIPNVVDESFFSPAHELPAANASFLAVAGLQPVKAIDLLLRAYAHVVQTHALPPLRIGGDGPLLASLRQLAASLGIGERVRFLGTLGRDQVREEMRRCAALVIASHAESFGVVAIEAMACGRPVLATACGGPEDIVTCETGTLVPRNDLTALSAGLVKLSATWQDFDSRVIRQTAEARFGRAAIAKRLCDLYVSILGKKPKGAAC